MPPLPVYSLVCHRDVSQAILCLGSFINYIREPITLHLVDDGSLTPDDHAALQQHFPQATILPPHAFGSLDARLAPYPALTQARQHYVMCRKLFDIPLIDNSPKLILDSDILFLRPFHGIHDAIASHPFICMRDLQSAYSPSLLARLRLRLKGLPLGSHCNCGFLAIDPAIIDLPLLESFFQNPAHHRHPALVEQTAWALLAARQPSYAYWDPQAVAFPPADLNPSAHTIAWHFASDFRALLQHASPTDNTHCQPQPIPTIPGQLLNLGEEIQRIRRHLNS